MAARRKLHPGPMDPSVLTFQQRHRSRFIWTDREFNGRIKPCRYGGQTIVPSDERMIHYLRVAGFYGVSHIEEIRLDHSLVTALIERWRPEVHAFHLPFGEVGITLQDVEVLLGLKVDGLAVTGRLKRPIPQWKEMCTRLLGFTPLDQFMTESKINSTAIPRVTELTANSTDEEVRVATRLQLMHLLGGFIFPETNNMWVNLCFLNFIEDFEACGQYSWGSAVLACLYRGLCKGADHNTTVVGGCMVLLQLWAWERLPMLRPECIIPQQNFRGLPVGARWVCPHFWGDVPNHVIRTYRDQLDRVNQQMFVFEPYNAFFPELPAYCTAGQAIWTARVPLIFFYIIEHYYPDRFCMQFGSFQDIPDEVSYSEALHALDGRSGNFDWADKHAEHLLHWIERAVYIHPVVYMNNPVQSDAYRVWYHTHGRLFIGNPEHRQDQGYVQCGASLNDAMHYLRDLHISTGEIDDDGEQALEKLREIHVTTREHLVRAGYGYFVDVPPNIFNVAPVDELEVQPPRANVRRHRQNRQGQPGRGGRRMRVINQALQAEADHHRHDAGDDDGGPEDVNALALVPVQYQGGEPNYDSQPFTNDVEFGRSSNLRSWEQSTSSGPNTSYCYPYSQAEFGGFSPSTPASQLYDPSQPTSSHHNAPPNIVPQFGAECRPAYNISPWPHPVVDFIVGESCSQGGLHSHNIGMPSTDDFLDVQQPQEPQVRRSTRTRFPTHCGTHPRQRYR